MVILHATLSSFTEPSALFFCISDFLDFFLQPSLFSLSAVHHLRMFFPIASIICTNVFGNCRRLSFTSFFDCLSSRPSLHPSDSLVTRGGPEATYCGCYSILPLHVRLLNSPFASLLSGILAYELQNKFSKAQNRSSNAQ